MMTQFEESMRENREQLTAQLSNAAVLASERERAWQLYETQGLPTKRNELWKYASLYNIQTMALALPVTESVEESEVRSAMLLAAQDKIVFVNGVYSEKLSCLSSDVVVALASNEARQVSEKVWRSEYAHSLEALHYALCQDGVVLHLSTDRDMDKPIYVLHLQTQTMQGASHTKTMIQVAPGITTNVIEHYVGLGEQSYLNNVMTHIDVAKNASINYCKVIQEGSAASHISKTIFTQEESSHVHAHSYQLDGKFVRADVTTNFKGQHAGCDLEGLFLGRDKQYIDQNLSTVHQVPNCRSSQNYKGILSDSAHGVFVGGVVVWQDAQKTSSEQSNQNILLSRDAEIDTKPQLEIYADDVKCAHGATVGQLDEESLFYLQSRGIDRLTGKHMLLRAFVDLTLQGKVSQLMQEKLKSIIMKQLLEMA